MYVCLCMCLYVYTCVCPLPLLPAPSVEGPPFPSDQDTGAFQQHPVELLLSGCETGSKSLTTSELQFLLV